MLTEGKKWLGLGGRGGARIASPGGKRGHVNQYGWMRGHLFKTKQNGLSTFLGVFEAATKRQKKKEFEFRMKFVRSIEKI